MPYQVLDTVVLEVDVPERGLRIGDLGAVVEVYGDEAVEVEFVTGAGETKALLSLRVDQVRPVAAGDMPAVRSSNHASAG